MMEVEVRGTQLQAKECRELLGAAGSQERRTEQILPPSLQKELTSLTPDFRLLASKTVK